jgi:hypothetical protein
LKWSEYTPKNRNLKVDWKKIKFREAPDPRLEGNMHNRVSRRRGNDARPDVVERGKEQRFRDIDEVFDSRLLGDDKSPETQELGRGDYANGRAGLEDNHFRSSTLGYPLHEEQVFKQQQYKQWLMRRASPIENPKKSATPPSPPLSGIVNKSTSTNKDRSKLDLLHFQD